MQHLSDEVLISMALSQWANHIETGNLSVSAEHAKASGHKVEPLNDRQAQTVERLRRLAKQSLRPKE